MKPNAASPSRALEEGSGTLATSKSKVKLLISSPVCWMTKVYSPSPIVVKPVPPELPPPAIDPSRSEFKLLGEKRLPPRFAKPPPGVAAVLPSTRA